MAIGGSCLCGGVRFEIDRAAGAFEICHCNRCRKLTGAAGLPALEVPADAFRLLAGAGLIERYDAPLLYRPPPYRATFCRRCGSPVPFAEPGAESVEVPAGLLDDDPGVTPDKHIYVDYAPPWDTDDAIPRFTRETIFEHRFGRKWPADRPARSHYDSPRED